MSDIILQPIVRNPLSVQSRLYNLEKFQNEIGQFDPRLDVLESLQFNVENFGAVGDGLTASQTAFNNTQSAAAAGGIIAIPGKTYNFTSYLLPRYSNITWRGVPNKTVLKNSAAQWMIQSSGAYPGVSNWTFEDIIFDGNAQGFGVFLGAYGLISNVTFRRCQFKGNAGFNLSFAGVNGIIVEDCVFHDAGIPTGQAINISNGCRNIKIRRNSFWYMREGIIGDTGTGINPISEKWDISDNFFEGGWWFIKSQFSGSGATVSYTSGTLTDTAANFTGIEVPYITNVIAMPVLRTGSGAGVTYGAYKITDTGADFVAAGIARGEIVRSGSLFGIVKSVEDATHLHIEGWIDQTTYQLSSTVPSAGASYTVYGVIIGMVNSFTSTTLTLFDVWYKLDGTRVTPPSQTRYEVLRHRPNYHLNAEYGAYDMQVSKNVFKRGWSDQCSIYGERVIITDNIIEDGEDMGITLHGKWNVVANNRVYHQGAGGMFINAVDSVISNNLCVDNQWVNNGNFYLGDIIITNDRNVVCGNQCRKESGAYSNYGIIVVAFNGEITSENTIVDNMTSGHAQAGFRYYADTTGVIANTHLLGNRFLETTKVSKGGAGVVNDLTLKDEWFNQNGTSVVRLGTDANSPYIALGYGAAADPQSGAIRLQNFQSIQWRNGSNNGDISGIYVDNLNMMRIGNSAIQITASGSTPMIIVDNTSAIKSVNAKAALKLDKVTAPGVSPVDTGFLFLRDNGSGKMQIAAQFPSGAIQVIATEP